MTEEQSGSPITTYGKTKLQAEVECLKLEDRLPVTIVRPPAVYGPRDKDVFEFFATMRKGLQPVVGFGEKYVSLLHVGDVVRGTIMAGESPKSVGQTYFLSSKKIYGWLEVGQVTRKVLGRRALTLRIPEAGVYVVATFAEFFALFSKKPALINFEKARDMVQDYWTCDSSKAKRDFGYEQEIGLEEGIRVPPLSSLPRPIGRPRALRCWRGHTLPVMIIPKPYENRADIPHQPDPLVRSGGGHVTLSHRPTIAEALHEASRDRLGREAGDVLRFDCAHCQPAKNGRSTKSFLAEGLWVPIMDSLRPGDYVFIQFGHNDQSVEKGERYAPPPLFRANLIRYVNDTRRKGGIPVLITPVMRRRFNDQGEFVDAHGEYPDIVRSVAKELDVPLIDLHRKSEELIKAYGIEGSKKLYLWVRPGENENYRRI
jgi:hypothetical protein